jgi:hypothetical protein
VVIIYQGRAVLHAGAIKAGVKPSSAVAGEVCKAAMSSGRGNYLANLILYPGACGWCWRRCWAALQEPPPSERHTLHGASRRLLGAALAVAAGAFWVAITDWLL